MQNRAIELRQAGIGIKEQSLVPRSIFLAAVTRETVAGTRIFHSEADGPLDNVAAIALYQKLGIGGSMDITKTGHLDG